MAFTPFSPRQPAASARLPLTLISLDDWALATLTGADAEKYLQGQVTADVSQMTEHQHLLPRIATQKAKCGATCVSSAVRTALPLLSAAACKRPSSKS
jgi:folate-binding Fe-S cluster repair protein YgfZ